MRHCLYHTDLGQNAVFHNFAIQIALIHAMFWTIEACVGVLAKPLKKIQNHLYGQPVLTFAARDVVECLNEH